MHAGGQLASQSTQDMEESMLQLVVSMVREQDRQFVFPVSKGLGGRKQRTNNIVASTHRLLKETLSAVVRMLYSSYANFG